MRASITILSVLVLSTFATASYAKSSIKGLHQIEASNLPDFRRADLLPIQKRDPTIEEAALKSPTLNKRKKHHKNNHSKVKGKKHNKGKKHIKGKKHNKGKKRVVKKHGGNKSSGGGPLGSITKGLPGGLL